MSVWSTSFRRACGYGARRWASKSRLRQLAEDAKALGSKGEGSWTTDPTVVIAEHKILEAQRRGAFDGIAKGAPLPESGQRDAAALMAKQMAAANVKPLSVELRLEVETKRRHLRELLRHKGGPPEVVRAKADELAALIKRQHLAAVADAHAFGTPNAAPRLQVALFDLDKEERAAAKTEPSEKGSLVS